MQCEVCGKPIFGNPAVVEIEGTRMRTCEACSRFGTPVKQPGKQREQRASLQGQPVLRSKRQRERIRTERSEPREIEPPEPMEDYNEIIRSARERLGMTREDLGKKINEKISVITRLESKKMQPDIKLAKKLERVLKIKILDYSKTEEPVDAPRTVTGGMTIGDMIRTTKRKGKG